MILITHHTSEPHGILGAQLAASFLQRRLSIPSIVIGVERNFSRESLLHSIDTSIIYHVSLLGDWIREIELKTDLTFGRDGTWIE